MLEAGKMRERVTLQRRTETNPDAPNDYGNTVSDWADQATVAAEFVHLRGGEAVIAGRLQGRHPLVIRIWASAVTRTVAADWRVVNARTGEAYAVRGVTPHVDGSALDILCEGGVAA